MGLDLKDCEWVVIDGINCQDFVFRGIAKGPPHTGAISKYPVAAGIGCDGLSLTASGRRNP